MGVVVVTWLFLNFAVCRDAARRAGLSATAKLLVIDCVHVYGLLLGLYGDYASVLLFFYLLCMTVLCLCCLTGVIKNDNNDNNNNMLPAAVSGMHRLWRRWAFLYWQRSERTAHNERVHCVGATVGEDIYNTDALCIAAGSAVPRLNHAVRIEAVVDYVPVSACGNA